jgi:hypothetical protein
MAKPTKEPELIEAPPEQKLQRLDVLVRDVLSVSNLTVRAKMEAAKRARCSRRKKRLKKS